MGVVGNDTVPLMRRHIPWSFVFVAAVIFSGCMRYTVGSRSFRDKSEALKAFEHKLATTLASVTPTATPVGGTARVVLPTPERTAESGILKRGNPAPDLIDYAVKTESMYLDTWGAAVEKRQIFRQVRVEHSALIGDPSPGGADFILWFYQPAPAAYQWYLSDASTKSRREVPIDLSKPEGLERVNAWLAALERAARRLQRHSNE